MSEEQFPQTSSKPEGESKEKGLGRALLTIPAKKLRMSRRKVEH